MTVNCAKHGNDVAASGGGGPVPRGRAACLACLNEAMVIVEEAEQDTPWAVANPPHCYATERCTKGSHPCGACPELAHCTLDYESKKRAGVPVRTPIRYCKSK